jgi:hypothetical protein
MSRNPELEAILQARYDLETAAPGEKTERRAHFEALVAAAVSKTGSKLLSHREVIEITAEAYQEFRLAKKKEERLRLSRLR